MWSDLNEIYSEFKREFSQMHQILWNDILLLENQLKINDNQTWRRLYIRTISTSTEINIEYLKSRMKIIGIQNKIETQIEITKREKVLNTDILFSDYKKRSFLEDLCNIIEFAYNSVFSDITINKKSQKWSDLTLLIDVRHRITHPKKSKDLRISDKELDICKRAYYGFLVSCLDLLHFLSKDNLKPELEDINDELLTNYL